MSVLPPSTATVAASHSSGSESCGDSSADKSTIQQQLRTTGREAYRGCEDSQRDSSVGVPFSNDAQILFTDFYQVSMVYAYWKSNMRSKEAVFDVFFRSCPFNGEFAVFAGLDECLRYINTISFNDADLEYVRKVMPAVEEEFLEYLQTLNGSLLKVYAVAEGTLVFANEPLLRVEGCLPLCQLVETALLNLLGYATLVATNAARHRLVAGWDKEMLEFGARRAQGPDGAMSAARYSYLGGFDGTSNVRAGHLFGIPVKGTHAHAFVTSYESLDTLPPGLQHGNANCKDFVGLVRSKWDEVKTFWNFLGPGEHKQQQGELAAFVAFAQAFPTSFLCLIDTYDSIRCGIPNFMAVALALHELGFEPIGIRLDSGDLAYLSRKVRKMFLQASERFAVPDLRRMKIVASNNINDAVLQALNEQGHSIDSFGIGTHLVTCQKEPALGLVYKLAEVDGRPCMKLSQEIAKTSVPSRKNVYRLYNRAGVPMIDLITRAGSEPEPLVGKQIFCCDLFHPHKRCYFTPMKVKPLLSLVWAHGQQTRLESLEQCRERCKRQLKKFPKETLRHTNPTPYSVLASSEFCRFFREMWEKTAPIFSLE